MARGDDRRLVDLLREAADAVEGGAAGAQDTESAPQPEREQADAQPDAAAQFAAQLKEAQDRTGWTTTPFV